MLVTKRMYFCDNVFTFWSTLIGNDCVTTGLHFGPYIAINSVSKAFIWVTMCFDFGN